MSYKYYGYFFLSLFFVNISQAEDIFAITDDGKKVQLKDDQTWSYVEMIEKEPDETESEIAEEKPVETKVDLRVVRKWEFKNACKYGLTLTNRKARYIKNLAPKLTAYLKGDVKYETVLVGFFGVKPTKYQFQEVIFRGVSCDDIDYIKVHGGDHCSVGKELTLFSIDQGECLAAIKVEESNLVKIHK